MQLPGSSSPLRIASVQRTILCHLRPPGPRSSFDRDGSHSKNHSPSSRAWSLRACLKTTKIALPNPDSRHLDRSRAVLSRDVVERPLYFVFAVVCYLLSCSTRSTLKGHNFSRAADSPKTSVRSRSESDRPPDSPLFNTGRERHLSKVRHGCEISKPIMSPTRISSLCSNVKIGVLVHHLREMPMRRSRYRRGSAGPIVQGGCWKASIEGSVALSKGNDGSLSLRNGLDIGPQLQRRLQA